MFQVIEVTELKLDYLGGHHDLRGFLEATMASGATKMAVICNMHMDVRIIEVIELNSEVRSHILGHYHCRPHVFRAIALLFGTGSPSFSP